MKYMPTTFVNRFFLNYEMDYGRNGLCVYVNLYYCFHVLCRFQMLYISVATYSIVSQIVMSIPKQIIYVGVGWVWLYNSQILHRTCESPGCRYIVWAFAYVNVLKP